MRRSGHPRISVGTSGWVYPHWKRIFYPPGLPAREQLAYYATRFSTVEVNATFYRLATRSAAEQWRAQAPEDFLFALKGSRFITHMKRLHEPARALRRFFAPLEPLKPRAGPVLWQLPPNFLPTPETLGRLEAFLRALPKGWRYAFEFRHPTWVNVPELPALLGKHRCALVWVSSRDMPDAATVTTDFIYLRFHGLAGGPFHDYRRRELEPWSKRLRASGLPGFAYFNNDLNPRVAENAELLQALLASRLVPRSRTRAPTSWQTTHS